ncbi:MAG: hypothetical protein KC643_29350 [Nitrospira sp.]|nr:hypothetical protein [Nitrospira sp.]
MTTEAQLLANRANGTKSHGPITDEGKAISRYNATKHGLLAKTDVLLHDETEDDLQAFTDALRADLQPQGATEDLLFQRVVGCAWRLKRAARIETSLLQWYISDEFNQRAFKRAWGCFEGTNSVKCPDGPLVDIAGFNEAGLDEITSRQQRDAPDTALGRAFARDCVEADAMTKLSRYERGLERSMLRSLWALGEHQRGRRKAQNITP